MPPVEPNKGSTARDQLANERTFLAWVRTGLGLIGVGVVLAKLAPTEGDVAEAGGLGFILWGAVVNVYAIVRYRKVAALLSQGQYQTAMRGPIALAVLGLVAAVAAVVMVAL
ncbi:MAG: DUF202 domain-containing protein [Polyangiaceae bacterium]